MWRCRQMHGDERRRILAWKASARHKVMRPAAGMSARSSGRKSGSPGQSRRNVRDGSSSTAVSWGRREAAWPGRCTQEQRAQLQNARCGGHSWQVCPWITRATVCLDRAGRSTLLESRRRYSRERCLRSCCCSRRMTHERTGRVSPE